MTIRLQDVGLVNSKPASEFKVGEKVGWNWGYISTITGITPTKMGKSLVFEYDGKHKRRHNPNRQLAIVRG